MDLHNEITFVLQQAFVEVNKMTSFFLRSSSSLGKWHRQLCVQIEHSGNVGPQFSGQCEALQKQICGSFDVLQSQIGAWLASKSTFHFYQPPIQLSKKELKPNYDDKRKREPHLKVKGFHIRHAGL